MASRVALRVLFLGPPNAAVIESIVRLGDEVVLWNDYLTDSVCPADILVSYRYRYIVRPDMLAKFPGGAINLHISYLPWNRGAHPNVWSHYDGTPIGVSIHHMDRGVDTGDIIAQRLVTLDPDATLRTSYEHLSKCVEELWLEMWPQIREGTAPRKPQSGPSSVHRVRDLALLAHLLGQGWDTPIAAVAQAGREARKTSGAADNAQLLRSDKPLI